MSRAQGLLTRTNWREAVLPRNTIAQEQCFLVSDSEGHILLCWIRDQKTNKTSKNVLLFRLIVLLCSRNGQTLVDRHLCQEIDTIIPNGAAPDGAGAGCCCPSKAGGTEGKQPPTAELLLPWLLPVGSSEC